MENQFENENFRLFYIKQRLPCIDTIAKIQSFANSDINPFLRIEHIALVMMKIIFQPAKSFFLSTDEEHHCIFSFGSAVCTVSFKASNLVPMNVDTSLVQRNKPHLFQNTQCFHKISLRSRGCSLVHNDLLFIML